MAKHNWDRDADGVRQVRIDTKRLLIATTLLLALTGCSGDGQSAKAQNMLSDAERGAIQKSREFCIEMLGGRERLNLRSFFGGDATASSLQAQVNECAMRELPRYLPPASNTPRPR